AVGAGLLAVAAADRSTGVLAVLVAAGCAVTFATHLDRGALQVAWVAGQWDAHPEFEKWNAFSRLTVRERPQRAFAWGYGSRFSAADWEVDQKALRIDSAATTVLTAFNGDFSQVPHLLFDVKALVHAIRSQGPVLVMGVGGGRDVLTALAVGHQRVVGVE